MLFFLFCIEDLQVKVCYCAFLEPKVDNDKCLFHFLVHTHAIFSKNQP